jgi:hypothetical protein
MTVRNQCSSTSMSTPRACLQGMGADTALWTTSRTHPAATHSNQPEGINTMATNGTMRATTARTLTTHPPERR